MPCRPESRQAQRNRATTNLVFWGKEEDSSFSEEKEAKRLSRLRGSTLRGGQHGEDLAERFRRGGVAAHE
jgi:hypothetical protein